MLSALYRGDTMAEWYAIKTTPDNVKDVYNVLKHLNCANLCIDSSLYRVVIGDFNLPNEAYVQVTLNKCCWNYRGLFAFKDSLQYQTTVLTLNQFKARFLQYTVTL